MLLFGSHRAAKRRRIHHSAMMQKMPAVVVVVAGRLSSDIDRGVRSTVVCCVSNCE